MAIVVGACWNYFSIAIQAIDVGIVVIFLTTGIICIVRAAWNEKKEKARIK